MTNNPKRAEGAALPNFRHGVCENEGREKQCYFFGWTQRNESNRYLCANCYGNSVLQAAKPEIAYINSVSLLPLYFHTNLIPKNVIQNHINDILEAYKKTGKITSRLGAENTVGYDYGLILYALTTYENPAALAVYKEMFSKLDETGAWVEYYKNDQPSGTMCRPWESAINLEAAINFLQSVYPNDSKKSGR